MSKAELFGKIAEGLEEAAAAFRELEGEMSNTGAKSSGSSNNGVAGKASKPADKANTSGVAGKSGKGGKKATVTIEQLKEKMTELINTEGKGKDSVMAILSEFGVAKLVELKEDDYADALAKVIEEINREDSDEGDGTDDDLFGD